jgi:AraC-like DNA-binding protein
MRLEKAVELFEKGNTSILDVSLSVGFHNLSYFHRAFKKKYHMTPLSFINEIKHQT